MTGGLDLGTLIARVAVETIEFDRGMQRVMSRLQTFGAAATKASSGSVKLDDSLASVGASGTRAAAGMDRAGRAATASGGAQQRAAAQAAQFARATTEVNAALNRTAAASPRVQAAVLRQVAAQERLNALQESGVATTRQLASAQASLISASAAVTRAQAAEAAAIEKSQARARAASEKTRAAIGTVAKATTAAALVIGYESVKQATEYQKSMTLLQTAGGETQAKMAVISKGVMRVAQQTGSSLNDLSEGMYVVAKAGAGKWSAVDQLEVLRAASQGARAENVPLSTSVSALTSVMMSYGSSARDAVSVENELIRGSGLAKTTMSEFANSLSNVVPLASSLHISFAQIAGAIATMTQHGETAQRSTDNLSNLITALAGQNNVASAAMQQLNIDTVDLQKNIGKRGLTGTLDIVERALAKNSHGGLVAVDAFKQAQKATSSLDTMMGTFSGTLKTQSQGLESGKVGITDYTKYAKSLGGQAGASALQFLSLYKATFGFNNALKSGNGDVSTAATQLQKMLGGVTGMRTALMLGGSSAKQFSANVDEVAKAANHAGTNVLGWGKTSKTLSQQMAVAKSNMQVLAVEVGTALLPALSKLATEGTKAISWVEGLSHTQKEILGWSVGIVAALGPVFAIGGRLVTLGRGIGVATTSIGNAFARLTTEATGMSTGMTRAMSGVTSALAGAGIGVAVGEMTKSSSTGVKALGALGAAATGAAIGFGVGGPLGAGVGALAGGVGDLAVQFLNSGKDAKHAGDQAKAALAAQKQEADNLLSSLQAVGGAYNTQFRQSIVQKLGSSGALGVANKAGINLGSVVDSVIGKGGPRAVAALNVQLENAAAAGKISFTELAKVQRALQALSPAATTAEKRLELENKAMGDGVLSADQLGTSYKKLHAALSDTGTSLDADTAAGKRNNAVIRQNLDNINASAQASLRQHKSITSVATAYEAQIGALTGNLHRLRFNTAAVSQLVGAYGKMPKSVATELIKRGVLPADIDAIAKRYAALPKSKSTNVGMHDGVTPRMPAVQDAINSLRQTHVPNINVHDNATNTLERIGSFLANLHDKTITVGVKPASSMGAHAVASGSQAVFKRSDGTIPPNTRFTVGENGWEGGMTDSQGRAIIFSQSQARSLGYETPRGYASGSSSSNIAAITNLLRSMGATRAGIAGFLGNTSVESGFRTHAYNPGENAHGFQQWEGGRLTVLERIADRMGKSITALPVQLQMIRHELTHGYGDTLNVLRHATSARSAAAYVDAHYERSSGDARQARENAAARLYGRIGHISGAPVAGARDEPGRAKPVPKLTQKQIDAVIGKDNFKVVVPALAKFAKNAAAVVTRGIVAAVHPEDTTLSGQAARLASGQNHAANLTQVSERSRSVYEQQQAHADKLTKQLATLRMEQRKGVDALREHATALSNDAHKAEEAASAMPSHTKAEKAAKDAAEKHAQALRDEARAASQQATTGGRVNAQVIAQLEARSKAASAAASKAKDAWGKAKSAAQDAQKAAQDAAKAVVDSLTSQVSALADAVSSFRSTIAQGISAGSDLSTVWGSVLQSQSDATDGLTTANQNLADAQQAVADAQQAINDANDQGDGGQAVLTAAQNAKAQAQAQYQAAHTALLAAAQAVSAGTGTPAQYAALTAAQARQTATLTALSAATADLSTAQQNLTTVAGPTQDQLDALTTAQANLATATTAASTAAAQAAANTGSGANLQAAFDKIKAGLVGFDSDLNQIVALGGNQDLISQIVGLGPDQGDVLAKQLLAGGRAGIAALQTTMTSIQNLAGSESANLAKGFYGAGVDSLTQLMKGFQKQFPALVAALAPEVAQLQAMFTFTPTVVTPGGSDATTSTGSATRVITTQYDNLLGDIAKNYGVKLTDIDALNARYAHASGMTKVAKGTQITIPGFASGVENFGGGLAYVHSKELVNFNTNSVTSAPRTADIFDMSGLERRIDATNARLDGLAGKIADGQLAVIDRYGQAHAKAQLTAARGRSPF